MPCYILSLSSHFVCFFFLVTMMKSELLLKLIDDEISLLLFFSCHVKSDCSCNINFDCYQQKFTSTVIVMLTMTKSELLLWCYRWWNLIFMSCKKRLFRIHHNMKFFILILFILHSYPKIPIKWNTWYPFWTPILKKQ